MPFLLSTVVSLRRIYALQEWQTLHIDAGSSRTFPGTGTETQRWKTLMVRTLVVCSVRTGRSGRTEIWEEHSLIRYQSHQRDFTIARPSLDLLDQYNSFSVSTQRREHDAGSTCCTVCFIHLSILTANERGGYYEWMLTPSYWHLYKYWLLYKGLLILFLKNFKWL